jgi:2-iminobutanoate/2-iminopropanoate deaminase
VAKVSHAVRVGDLIFTAGQGPRDPASGKVIRGDIRAHTRRTMENLKAILETAGSSWAEVVQATVWLADIANDFDGFNEVYNSYLARDYPARAVIQAGKLNWGMKVEIQVVAAAGAGKRGPAGGRRARR